MAQLFSGQPSPRSPQPFSEARDPAVTSGLFWARLLTYRPLFLLGGLWLTLVCMSAIAYHGLMFNEPIEDVAPEVPLTVLPVPADDAASAPEVVPVEDSPQAGVALWGLLSLVGLCAFGSFVLTQQIKASSRVTKRKKARPRPVVKASMPVQPPHPKRLAPYSPRRDGVVAPGVRLVETPMVELPPNPAPMPARSRAGAVPKFRPVPQPGRQSGLPRGESPQSSTPRAAPSPSATPAVVPPEADLPLDWTEGSVAHALDMRQRRSLSSLM